LLQSDILPQNQAVGKTWSDKLHNNISFILYIKFLRGCSPICNYLYTKCICNQCKACEFKSHSCWGVLGVKLFCQPIYTDYANLAYFDKRSYLNLLLLWNCWTKFEWDGPCMVSFKNCVGQPRPPFKMANITKNRTFFNWLLLLYYKSKWAQILTAAAMTLSSSIYLSIFFQ